MVVGGVRRCLGHRVEGTAPALGAPDGASPARRVACGLMAPSARTRPIGGEFRYQHPIEIRFVDTDALGHVNNAVYLSYFEMARGGYYTRCRRASLRPRAGGRAAHLRHRRGACHLPHAGALRRAAQPVPAGSAGWALVVQPRVPPGGGGVSASDRRASSPTVRPCRSSSTSWTARSCASRRRWRGGWLSSRTVRCPAAQATPDEGFPLRSPGPAVGRSKGSDGWQSGPQASKRRKTATAFWPPKPNPLIIAVSTLAWRATFGT